MDTTSSSTSSSSSASASASAFLALPPPPISSTLTPRPPPMPVFPPQGFSPAAGPLFELIIPSPLAPGPFSLKIRVVKRLLRTYQISAQSLVEAVNSLTFTVENSPSNSPHTALIACKHDGKPIRLERSAQMWTVQRIKDEPYETYSILCRCHCSSSKNHFGGSLRFSMRIGDFTLQSGGITFLSKLPPSSPPRRRSPCKRSRGTGSCEEPPPAQSRTPSPTSLVPTVGVLTPPTSTPSPRDLMPHYLIPAQLATWPSDTAAAHSSPLPSPSPLVYEIFPASQPRTDFPSPQQQPPVVPEVTPFSPQLSRSTLIPSNASPRRTASPSCSLIPPRSPTTRQTARQIFPPLDETPPNVSELPSQTSCSVATVPCPVSPVQSTTMTVDTASADTSSHSPLWLSNSNGPERTQTPPQQCTLFATPISIALAQQQVQQPSLPESSIPLTQNDSPGTRLLPNSPETPSPARSPPMDYTSFEITIQSPQCFLQHGQYKPWLMALKNTWELNPDSRTSIILWNSTMCNPQLDSWLHAPYLAVSQPAPRAWRPKGRLKSS
ncbi:hypothetical protein Pelo_11420 [Pelomyxa schiedti]|nr:hypothetical protein Pelo_11420 [Pelomyxa schiedti]